ncbi:MAG: thiamine pyrophosphate-dependent dehydrogenase E1 component subunit alpha [Armatimonadetes bacterium]|nr:thiamine pyrophosphate-dependent dehydrogenase E1 component subunit alpha [Armatimonadota bacterium]
MIRPPRESLVRMYQRMQQIRQLEEKVYYLFLQGDMPGTLHLYIGMEACAVGVCENLRHEDYITSTHRPHGHAIAKGVSLKAVMAELFGKSVGCCGGYGGSMHVGDLAVGSVPAIAIVGGGVPVATGIGLSCKMRKTDNVVCCFFGDGAVNEGAFHEGLNMAALWDLPVVFVCENNLYAASTPIAQAVKLAHLSERAGAYGIPGVTVDGNDVLAVYEVVGQAVERARRGEGPTFVECNTYRLCGHSRSDTCGYRDREEEAEWKKRDPLLVMEENLTEAKLITPDELLGIKEAVAREIDEAVQFARAGQTPKPEDCMQHVCAEE